MKGLLDFIFIFAVGCVTAGYIITGIQFVMSALNATRQQKMTEAIGLYFAASAFIIAAGFLIGISSNIINDKI